MNIDELKKIVDGCELQENKICIKNDLHYVIEFLKNNYGLNLLKSITAIDLGEDVELLYNLFSVDDGENVVISIKVQNEAESVSDLFDSAKADENEIYDLFGINFTGNENQKRLYMPENWEGYPLRKDYVQDDTRLAWNENDRSNA